MRVHRGEAPSHGEPPDTWTVVRRWLGVPAASALKAIELSSEVAHAEVLAFRDDLSPRLYDRPIHTVVLCTYTGHLQDDDGPCLYREQRRHPDLECQYAYTRVLP